MTRVIMAALQGEPIGGGPQIGPNLKLLGLAGHDTNLVLMASTFGAELDAAGRARLHRAVHRARLRAVARRRRAAMCAP